MKRVKEFFQKFKYKLLFFLAIIGPGLITAIADNDAGGVATYTVAASLYGMASQFLIIPETILLFVSQEVGARIAIVARKGLGDLIRERYGVRIALLVFIIYFITNQGVVLQNITGLKAALQLFNLNWRVYLIFINLSLVLFVVAFDYRRIQKIFLIMIFFYLTYVISAFLSKPDWSKAMYQSFIWPQGIDLKDLGFWFSRIAVLGTTITAWGQFFIQSFILDKKLSIDHLKTTKIEIFGGSLITSFFSWMIAIAVTASLFNHGILLKSGYQAALAMEPFAGHLSTVLFSFGLFGASILGLTIVPLATAYVFSEMFGYEGSLDADFKKGKLFYVFFTLQLLIGLAISLFPNISLFNLTLYADYLNGLMLPIIFYFLIKFSEDKEIMGEYVSRGFSSFFPRLSAILIVIAVLVTFFGKVIHII